jgi:SAM-dependent methyltransferase
MVGAYRDDLATIHDTGFGGPAQAAAAVLLEALRRRGINRGLVVDLGCGSGILAGELSAAGYDILGIDISAAMVSLARQRVPKGRFRCESLLKAELPSCVAVAAVGECFNYLFDASNTERSLAKRIGRIFDALDPGGLFLFDIAEPGRVPGPAPRRTYTEGKDWAVLVTAEEDRRHRSLTRRITTFRQVGEFYRRDHEVHRLRLIPRAAMTALLRGLGFRVRVLRSYGPLPFVRGHVGFLARKPGHARAGGDRA